MYQRSQYLAALLSLSACSGASKTASPELADPLPREGKSMQTVAAETLGDRSACLLITNAAGEPLLRTDEDRCAHPYRPFSTFKIPNSIIGLETGHLKDAKSDIEWDSKTYPPQDWWPAVWTAQTHDLRSAFRYSHVPYYRTLATQISKETMAKYISQFGYGNQNVSGSQDSFWLNGDIAISADQQIEFLRRFYEERLGVSPHTTAVVKDIFVRDRSGDAVLSAKTGTGVAEDGSALAWLVGYVENVGAVHYFALNVSNDDADSVSPKWRVDTIEAVLASEGIWPSSGEPVP
ncbi:MAG: class D beta-lactamase [Kofleriaceae bacterium]|nr:class D beta-lactamase [Kofleriaceae bacterium]